MSSVSLGSNPYCSAEPFLCAQQCQVHVAQKTTRQASFLLLICIFDTFQTFCPVTGSVGEGYHLTLDERKRVAETWVQAGKGKCVLLLLLFSKLREDRLFVHFIHWHFEALTHQPTTSLCNLAIEWGLGPTLLHFAKIRNQNEKIIVLNFVWQRLRHIIVHISGNNYKESQELVSSVQRLPSVFQWPKVPQFEHIKKASRSLQAKHAQDIGADAIGCMAPSYFKPETAGTLVQ